MKENYSEMKLEIALIAINATF